MSRRPLYVLSLILVIIGAINWLLVALARLDLVALAAGLEFGEVGGFNGAVYAIVGVAGIYLAVASWIAKPVEAPRKGDTRPLPR